MGKMPLKPSKTRYKVPLVRRTIRHSSTSYERKKLIKELDKYYSWFVRLSAADAYGNAICYCCGKKVPYQLGDCAHYCKRGYFGTRWLLDNLRFNCVSCNRYKNGNYSAYTRHLLRDIGADGIQKLWDKAYDRRKISDWELDEMLKKIKHDYKELVETRQQKGWKC